MHEIELTEETLEELRTALGTKELEKKFNDLVAAFQMLQSVVSQLQSSMDQLYGEPVMTVTVPNYMSVDRPKITPGESQRGVSQIVR